MDWLDLLAVQGTLQSLLQHHSSKASILWRSAFFSGGQKEFCGDFLGGLVLKDSPFNAGDVGLILGGGLRSHMPQSNYSPCPATTELRCRN